MNLKFLFRIFFLAVAAAWGGSARAQEGAQPTPPAQSALSQYVSADGLTAERLTEAAFAANRDLLAARQNQVITQGRLLQAGLRPNPTLDVQQTTDRFTTREGERDLSVGFSYLFETGGKRGKRVAVARLEYDRAQAEVRALERQLAAEVRTAYAQAVAAARQLATAEQLITLDREIVRVTEARLSEGDAAPLDVNLVRVELDRLRAQAVQAQGELQAQLITLKALTGALPEADLKLALLTERPPQLSLPLAAATEAALRERPDLQAARIAEELGGARLGLAEAQRAPDVVGAVRYSRQRSIFDETPASVGELRDNDQVLTFGVTIELPLRNRNQGEIAAAAAERQQAKYRREFIEAVIRRDVALAYSRYNAAAATLALYGGQILPRSEQNLRTIRAAYNLGEMQVTDVVAEQRRLVDSQTQYNAALRDYYVALAELEKALGAPLPPSAFSPTPVVTSADGAAQQPVRATAAPVSQSANVPEERR
jgi:outer membrane protein, heavy metal efflux system